MQAMTSSLRSNNCFRTALAMQTVGATSRTLAPRMLDNWQSQDESVPPTETPSLRIWADCAPSMSCRRPRRAAAAGSVRGPPTLPLLSCPLCCTRRRSSSVRSRRRSAGAVGTVDLRRLTRGRLLERAMRTARGQRGAVLAGGPQGAGAAQQTATAGIASAEPGVESSAGTAAETVTETGTVEAAGTGTRASIATENAAASIARAGGTAVAQIAAAHTVRAILAALIRDVVAEGSGTTVDRLEAVATATLLMALPRAACSECRPWSRQGPKCRWQRCGRAFVV